MMISRRNALVLSAVAAAGLPVTRAQAAIKTQWVDYQHGDTALRGYLAYDETLGGKRPAVLLIHRRDGMSELTLQNAEMVAKQGYVVFAADIFGRDHQPKDVQAQIEASGAMNKDRPLMRARTQAGFDILKQNPLTDTSRIATLGYCFGGTVVIEFAEMGAPVLGTVTIHGSFRDFAPGAAKNIAGRVLILHGSEDPVAPLKEVDLLVNELRAAKVNWELNLYSGTEHGFSTPKNAAEERANTESQAAAARFFKEVFGIAV